MAEPLSGAELDEAVLVRVMGLPATMSLMKRPSELIAHAWEVVERMRERNYYLVLSYDGTHWEASFAWTLEALAPTACEAICQAALLVTPEPSGNPG